MATKPNKTKRGRPQEDFLQDPERFAIALALAFRTAFRASENDAYRAVAAVAFGRKVATEVVGPRRKQGRGAIPAGLQVTYGRVQHSAIGSLPGRATSLRQKGHRTERDPKAVAWLLEMEGAFTLALQAAPSAERCATRILELGQLVTKGVLAENQLLNVLSGELPDLITNDPARE